MTLYVSIYSIEGGSTIYIVWSCAFAMDVWGVCEKKIQKSQCNVFEFLQVVGYALKMFY